MAGILSGRGATFWRTFLWGGAALALLLPLAAMQVSDDVNWTGRDFLFAALVIGAAGATLELAVRMGRSSAYRMAGAIGIGTGTLLTWSNAAVGYIGAEDNGFNLLFHAIVAGAFVGALLSRFAARGMALTMSLAGLAHAVVGGIGVAADPVTAPITAVFVILWLTSAYLFHKAAAEER